MEDIGCHFKFENYSGNCYHNTNLLLSSGRNSLRYIIKERKITNLFLPYFLCESLTDVSLLENVNIIYYHLDNNMMPIVDEKQLNENSFLYFVNYYGLLRDKIGSIVDNYKHIIIDNTHDFFDTTLYNADVIYNYRKYFGVPDGSCIMSRDLLRNEKYEVGKSLGKIIEMISRDETGEYFHYSSFLEADKHYRSEDLCYMSNFTANYLKAIDYYKALRQRLNNYKYLSEGLNGINSLDVSQRELTFMYPFLCNNGEKLRKYLQANNIYSQMLWPNVEWNGCDDNEVHIARQMVLLPIDQRYSEEEMQYIIDTINNYNNARVLKK